MLAALLVTALAVPTAFGQNRGSRDQTPPAPPADSPVVSIPLGPNDVTEYVVPTNVVRSGGTEQELVRAIAQASGCRVGWLSKTQSLMLTGTPPQIELAMSTLTKLTEGAQVTADRLAAERKAQSDAEIAKAEAKAKADVASKALFDIDFQGGSVKQYLSTVADKTGFTGLVIQNAAALQDLPMPAVALRGTDLRTAIELVAKIQFAPDQTGRERALNLEWVGKALQASSPYSPSEFENLLRSACVVSFTAYTSRSGRPPVPSPPLERAALDLSALYLGGDANVQSILDAITLAIEIDGPSESFVAKFHEPSHLLIVRGTGPEIAIVREIVQTCLARNTAAAPANQASAEDEKPDELTLAKQKLQEVSIARQAPNLSEPEKRRIEKEFYETLERIKELQKKR